MKNFLTGKKTADPYAYNIGGGTTKADPYAYSVGSSKPDPYAYNLGGGGGTGSSTNTIPGGPYGKTASSWQSTNKKQPQPSRSHQPPKDLIPQKIALAYDIPTILIEYRDPTSDKLYHHKIFLKKLTRDTKISDVLDYLKKKHAVYTRNIDPQQIEKLVDKLKSKLSSGKGAQLGVGKSSTTMAKKPEVIEEKQDDFDYDVDYDEEEDY